LSMWGSNNALYPIVLWYQLLFVNFVGS
jgi:hypothetical protein